MPGRLGSPVAGIPAFEEPSAADPRPAVPVAGPPEHLYVHVPFCVSLCPYCDFVVVAGTAARGPKNRIAPFLAALRRELDLRADLADERWGAPGDLARPALTSLYFGGGTPSLLPATEIAGLVAQVRRRFDLAPGAEVTLEANPGPDERGDASALADAGVTRLSFGAQALDDSTLRALGRRHRAADVGDAVVRARAAGIRSVSLDLLYDVPDGTLQTWTAALESAVSLQPDHLSLYALTLDDPDAEGLTGTDGDHLPMSRGARRWRATARPRQDEDRAEEMYQHAVDHLAAAGFHGYEISNWARPGHESWHNLAYWERRPFEAVGPGAHAFDGSTRRWNAGRLDAYLVALVPPEGGPGHLPPGGEERIDARTAAVESIILGLRTSHGIDAAAARRLPLRDHYGWAVENGLLQPSGADRIVLTTRGRLLSNELFSRLV